MNFHLHRAVSPNVIISLFLLKKLWKHFRSFSPTLTLTGRLPQNIFLLRDQSTANAQSSQPLNRINFFRKIQLRKVNKAQFLPQNTYPLSSGFTRKKYSHNERLPARNDLNAKEVQGKKRPDSVILLPNNSIGIVPRVAVFN